MVLSILLFLPSQSYASALVETDAPLPVKITVNGSEFLLNTSQASLSGKICFPQFLYLNTFVRFYFSGWYSNGTLLESKNCYTITSGQYLAHYTKQYLITIIYSPQGVVANSTWADAGSLTSFNVPTLIADRDYSYKLHKVLIQGSPIFAPFGKFQISADNPTNIEALYDVFVNVTLILPSSRQTIWVPIDKPWYYTFPPIMESGNESRYRLDGFNVIGASQYTISSNTIIVNPSSPLTIQPIYNLYYSVMVDGPSGILLRGWFKQGSLANITAPQQLQLNEQEKLVFTGWKGANGTSSLSIQVNGPIHLSAIYATEYQVTQISPLGSSSRFVMKGNATALYFPPILPASLGFTRYLKTVLVNGIEVQNNGGVIVLSVQGPTEVTAVYEYGPDYVFIAIILIIVVLVSIGYILSSKRKKLI